MAFVLFAIELIAAKINYIVILEYSSKEVKAIFGRNYKEFRLAIGA